MSTIGNISERTKWLVSKRYVQATIIIALTTFAIVVPFIPKIFALTDVGNAGVFELDGNIVRDGTSTDWGNGPGGTGLFSSTGATNPLPSGGLDAHWVNDGPHAVTDNTTFTTGSKDTLDIANNGWQCTPSSNITPKDDILHAYSFAIIPGSGNRAGHLLVYGGFERFANNGAGDLGFWLLQDPTVACSSPKGAVSFIGAHVVGDLLVVGEFSIGGSVTTLNEFEWVGISKANPLGLVNVTSTGGADCTVAPVTTNVCARSNTGSISTPWATQDKTSGPNTLATAEFFEVGLDLTGILGPNPPCINRFLFNTRTSPSLTATLVDYAIGALKTCAKAGITTSVSPSTIALGGSATDTATVTLTPGGQTVNGTVTFNVFGPFSSAPTSASCTMSSLVTPFSPNTVNIGPGLSPQSATSGTFTPSAAGYYAWTATYNPAGPRNGNTNSTKCGDTGETLLVVQAKITTSVSPSTIAFGSSATDTATVTLTPGGQTVSGTVDFFVFGPVSTNIATCTTQAGSFLGVPIGPGVSPQSATSPSFTPSAPGFYFWTATYNPSGAANGNTVSTTCGDTGETLTVVKAMISTTVSPSTITFGQSATDTATVTLIPSTATVSGTVDFFVFGPVSTNIATCTTQAGSFLGVPIGPGVSPQSATSPSFTPSAPGFYFWTATYNPSTAANGNTVSTTCGDTGETLTVVSIPKITAFGFTNTPTNNDPTRGSGTVVYTFTIHNYGTTAVTLSGSLAVTGTASVTCTGGNTLTLSGSLAGGADAPFSLSCMYSGTSGQTVQATINAMFTDLNGHTDVVSGSPTTYLFTIQTK